MAWDEREEPDFDMDLPFDEESDERDFEDDFGEEDDELDRLDRMPMADDNDFIFDDYATDTPIGLAYGGYEAPDFEDF